MQQTSEDTEPQAKSIGIEFVAGITSFLACAYIVFFAPAQLQKIGLDYGAVIAATCFICLVSCIFVGTVARTPTVLAPATGIILLSVDAVEARFGLPTAEPMAWQGVLTASFMAGCIVFVASHLRTRSGRKLRLAILEVIPPPLRAAVVAGIGGLLAGNALQSVLQHQAAQSISASAQQVEDTATYGLMFVVGVSIIIVIELYFKAKAARLKEKTKEARRSDVPTKTVAYFELAAAASILSSILAMTFLIWAFQGFEPVPKFELGCVWCDLGFEAAAKAVWALKFDGWVLGLTGAMLFTLFIDFVGSPYDFRENTGAREDKLTLAQVERGTTADSVMMTVSPALGLTPTVYFGENHAGWLAGGRTRVTVFVSALGFAALTALIMASAAFGWQLNAFISPLVLAPAVFWIGVKIIGNSMTTKNSTGGTSGFSPRNVTVPVAISSVVSAVYSFPSAIFLGFAVHLLLVGLDHEIESYSMKDWPVFFLTGLAALAAYYG